MNSSILFIPPASHGPSVARTYSLGTFKGVFIPAPPLIDLMKRKLRELQRQDVRLHRTIKELREAIIALERPEH